MKKTVCTCKKYTALAVTLAVLTLFAGCSGETGGSGAAPGGSVGSGVDSGGSQPLETDTLTGATADILRKVLDDAAAALSEADTLPETFTDAVTSENAPGTLGVTADDFVSYVTEATSATASISTFAFQAALIKCTDANATQTVNDMILSAYESGKWICVMPEQSLTSVSGSYILLAVGKKTHTDAIAEAFKTAAGGVVSGPNIFYEGETGDATAPPATGGLIAG